MRLVSYATVLETEKILVSEVISISRPEKFEETLSEKYLDIKPFNNCSLGDQLKSKILRK